MNRRKLPILFASLGFIVLAVFLMPTTSNDVQGLAARAVRRRIIL